MPILPKRTYRFNATPSKFQYQFLQKLGKNPKVCMELQKPQIAKAPEKEQTLKHYNF